MEGKRDATHRSLIPHGGIPRERTDMSILTDTDLERVIKDSSSGSNKSQLVIDPFDEKSLTPVGYDLRVGETYTTSDIGQIQKNLSEGEKITLKPGTTALISTLEDVQMPKDKTVTGLIESKVSQVSKGLSHVSTTVDPDWRGHLLIAIHNHAIEEIELAYGETFCTVVFFKNESPATRDSDKQPHRLDIFLKQFQEKSIGAQRAEKRKNWIAPAIMLGVAGFAGLAGYYIFGNSEGLTAAVTVGLAVARFIERRYLR